jgi:hypothetical protein
VCFWRDYYSLVTELKLSLHSLLIYYFELKLATNIPRVTFYSLGANSTENSIVLLVNAGRTENISRSSYCCAVNNCRRDVFPSALHSNERGVATLSTVVCVTQQRAINTYIFIVVCVFRGFCGVTVLALGKYATVQRNTYLSLHWWNTAILDNRWKFVNTE